MRHGLTLNERLRVSGLLSKFDEAIAAGDQEEAVKLLLKTGLRKPEAEDKVNNILADPKAYGYGL
ncbi:MAG: hypothetical protein R3352_01390 [Salinisphaeraceae bacterium]|nr:hypothetical protein [Salinisphaeraceae bacterium]